ncbi:hypothetical protein GCM10010094_50550 [Streptomyces flaveus]|uniref:Uncharacterized protein n=1 Tax=Streptomyces flaveus TaxID=66370 RepID=A0A917R221_9ACTN|nr:hypothetical protein GCM10010094_50550 [Streptomyces flaveus]
MGGSVVRVVGGPAAEPLMDAVAPAALTRPIPRGFAPDPVSGASPRTPAPQTPEGLIFRGLG